MADYAITAANVLASTSATKTTGVAGVTITAGQLLYKAADNTMKLFDANVAAPVNVLQGIALHASLAGQPITYATADPDFTPGTTMAAGDTVIGSATPGAMCPDADKATGWRLTEVGHGKGGNKMVLSIVATNADVP